MDQHLLGLLEKGSLRRAAWEIKTIQEIATQIFSGAEITKAQLGAGDHPAIKCGDLNSKLGYHFTECISFVDGDAIRNKKYFECGDVLVSDMGDLKTIGSASAYLGKQRGLAGNVVFVIKHNENPKYLAYALSSRYCRQQIENKSQISTVVRLYMNSLKQIKIPLPPRPIQDLIADILDKWTYLQEELARELARELECRKKQYQYYKEMVLMNEANKWGHKNLEEIATNIYSGAEVTRTQLGQGTYPAVKCGDINSRLDSFFHRCISFVDEGQIKNKKYFEKGDLLISNLSNKVETIGSVAVYCGEDRCLAGGHVIVVKHRQRAHYLAYILSSKFCRDQISKLVQKGTVYDLFLSKIKQIKVPLPPIKEQERIVSLLDPLYEMCGDAEKGIPALIAVIQKQYQYYKEELLRV